MQADADILRAAEPEDGDQPVVHSLTVLCISTMPAESWAIFSRKKNMKPCFYDSGLKYTKIWSENILEDALPQKVGSHFSSSVHNN